MGHWERLVIRNGLGQATITSSGAATGLNTGPYRSAAIYSYVHTSGGTTPTFRLLYQVSPNYMTGSPPGLNAAAVWVTHLSGVTYSGTTGPKVMFIPDGEVGQYSRVGWVTSGPGARIKASLWLGLKE